MPRDLSDCPIDILLEIATHLDVKSLIRLALTSKTIGGFIFADRLVWLNIARDSLARNGVSEAALFKPLQLLDVEGLQKLATRPFRFAYHLQSHRKLDFSPFLHRRLFLFDSKGQTSFGIKIDVDRWRYQNLYLVSGGRWLVCCPHEDERIGSNPVLVCWEIEDVKATAEAHIVPTSVPMPTHLGPRAQCTIAVRESGSSSYLMLWEKTDDHVLHVEVLEVVWSAGSSNPQVSSVGMEQINLAMFALENESVDENQISLQGASVVVYFDKIVILWAWSAGKVFYWRELADDPDSSYIIPMPPIVLNDRFVVLLAPPSLWHQEKEVSCLRQVEVSPSILDSQDLQTKSSFLFDVQFTPLYWRSAFPSTEAHEEARLVYVHSHLGPILISVREVGDTTLREFHNFEGDIVTAQWYPSLQPTLTSMDQRRSMLQSTRCESNEHWFVLINKPDLTARNELEDNSTGEVTAPGRVVMPYESALYMCLVSGVFVAEPYSLKAGELDLYLFD